MSDLDITGRVSMDASQAERALENLSAQAGKMSVDMAKAGDATRKAVEKIGDISTANGEKFTKSEGTIVNSIKRLAAEAAKAQPVLDKLGNIEFNIAAKGLDYAKFAPYIDVIKSVSKEAQESAVAIASASSKAGTAASASLNKIGISAGQTAAALRGVPAQFTDIVTSLQGGQAPLTVFLQQGGQLKDMFGGAGNAARALGGYVLGLINPFTVAAAAIGAIGLAYYSGSQEAAAFTKAIVLSGNAAGVTASQLGAMAGNIAKISGSTQGAAAEALAAVVQSGAVGSENLEKFSAAAINYSKATGQAVGDTVKQFEELKKGPVEASLKLNDSTNYLTASLYRQIKALDEQGRTVEAASLAQTAYADTISSRASEIITNLGLIERGWNAVASAGKRALDDIKGIGRADSLAEKIAQKQQEVDAFASAKYTNSSGLTDRGRAIKLEQMQAELASLKEVDRLSGKVAANRAAEAEQVKALAAFDKQGDEFKTKVAKRDEAVTKAQIEGQKLVAAGLITEKDLRERIADINKKYEDKSDGNTANRSQSEYDKLIASIKAKIALNEAEIAGNEKQNESDKLRISLMAQIEQGSRKMTAARLDDAKAQLRQLDESEKAKALYLSQKKFEKERDKEDQSIAGDIAKINERAQALEDEAKVYGMTATELQALTIARLEEKKALISGFDGSEKRVAQIEDEIAALNRLASAGVDLADAKLADKTSGMLRDAKAQAEIYEQENSLSGLTALERAKITAQRKVEYEYAKKIADVDKSGASDAAKTEAKSSLNEAKLIASSAAVNKVVQDEWQKTADSINNSLTDALLRGFESGKDFAANLRDTVVNMFKTLVLRPIISAVVNPVAGALTGALGFGGAASAATGGGGFGGIGNLLGTGISSAITGGLSAGFSGLTGSIGSLFGAAGTGTTLGGSLSAGVTALGAGNIAGGLSTLAGSLGPIALGAAALASAMKYTVEFKGSGIVANLGGGGDVARYNEFQQTGGLFGGGTTTNRDWSKAEQGLSDFVNNSVKAITDVNKSYARAIGLTSDSISDSISDFTKSVEINLNGLDAAAQQAAIAKELLKFAGDQAAAAFGDSVKQFAKDGENTAQTVARLATDLTVANRTFADLGLTMFDVSVGGAAAAAGIVDLMGGLEQFSALASEYFRNFYSEGEQRNAQAEYIRGTLAEGGINVTVDQILGGSREQFRQLVEAQDLSTESGRKAYAALMKVNGAFANLTPAVDSAATATNEAAQRAAEAAARERQRAAEAAAAEAKRQAEAYASAFKSAQDYISGIADNIKNFLAGLDAQAEGLQSYNKVAAAFSAQMALAKGGDRNSLDGITNTASTLIDVIRRESSSQAEANLRIGRVRGQLSGLPAQLSPEQFIVDGLSTVITTSTTTTGTTITTAAASIVSGYNAAIDGLIGALDTGFALIDGDGSGAITLAEMQTALAGKASDSELSRLFDLIDVDNNGILTKLEVANAQTNTFGAQVKAALSADFTKLDTSVNNALDFSEFSAGLNGLASDSELRRIFNELDTNGDGVISRLESISANTSTLQNGLFNPNDPIRSVFDAIRADTLANGWMLEAIANNTSGTQYYLGASFRGDGSLTIRGATTAFAKGGVFTDSVVSSPTLFNMGLMGEAGPEAIMPLTRTSSGDLGVQMVMPSFANYGNGGQSQAALVAEIRALRSDNQAQARSLVQLQQRMNKLLERWDGNGMPEVRVVA